MTHLPPDYRTVLKTGLNWLYAEQPEGAMVSGHGLILYADNDRSYSFIPYGTRDLPLVVVRLSDPRRNPDSTPAEFLEADEMSTLGEVLTELGHPVNATWDGTGQITGSLELERRAHPAVYAALELFKRGCPTHTHPSQRINCKCGWDAEGRRRLRVPRAALMERPGLPQRPKARIPRQRASEPDLPPTSGHAPQHEPKPTLATPSLLRSVLVGLANLLDTPEPERRVEAKFTCGKCGMKVNFEGTDLATFEAKLVEVWKGHTCAEPSSERE